MLQDHEIKTNIIETIKELNHYNIPATRDKIYIGSRTKDHVVFERIIREMIENNDLLDSDNILIIVDREEPINSPKWHGELSGTIKLINIIDKDMARSLLSSLVKPNHKRLIP